MQLRQQPAPPRKPALRVVPAEGAEPAADLSRKTYFVVVAAAIAIGCAVRLSLVLASDFPLNDGGLFYTMVGDIQANGYALPAFTSYNGGNIPFAYPPLAMYLAALLNDATGIGLIQFFRFLPMLASCLTIPAFLLLARSMLTTRRAVFLSVIMFGLIPPGFMWMIMGGGLTRATGFVFALLALHQVQQMYVRRTAWRVLPVSLLAALTVMSHLEMAWFVAFSSALFFLSYARSWYGVRVSLAVAVLTALLSSPWWLTVVSHHGIGPIVAAMHTGTFPLAGPIILLAFDPTIEPLFALVASLALLGGFSCVLHRRYLLPAWVVAAACFDVRAFATSSTVPIAMLAAIGVQDVLLPAVRHYALFRPSLAVREGAPRPLARPPAWAATAVLGAIIAYATLSAFITAPKLLAAMHPEERDAMAWVAANTPADSRFVIISEDKWPVDRTSEWFPTLTHRESIATVQGAEWLPSGVFAQKVQDHLNLQKCSIQLVACLDKWSADTGKTYDYVVIPKLGPRLGKDAQGPCCLSIRDSLAADPRFETVFDNDGARIFRLIAAQR